MRTSGCADAHIFPAVSLRNRYYGKRSKKICRFFEKGRSEILADPANLSDQLRRFPYQSFSSFAGNPYFMI